MRAHFIFPVPVILERLAQPAASLAVAIAVDVADTRARIDQTIAGPPSGNPDIADSQAQVFVALDTIDC